MIGHGAAALAAVQVGQAAPAAPVPPAAPAAAAPAQSRATTVSQSATPAPGEPKVTVNPDGRMVISSPDGGTTISYPDGRTTHIDPGGHMEQTAPPGMYPEPVGPDPGPIVSGIVLSAAIAFFLGRWSGRRATRRRVGAEGLAAGIPADLGSRIDRIEHAVDSVAIEVERISEGQRFTTKLLSERGSAPAEPIVMSRGDEVGGGRR